MSTSVQNMEYSPAQIFSEQDFERVLKCCKKHPEFKDKIMQSVS